MRAGTAGAVVLLMLVSLRVQAEGEDGGTGEVADAGSLDAGSVETEETPEVAPPEPAVAPLEPNSTVAAVNAVTAVVEKLNPELSAVVDVTGGFSSAVPYRLAGDDPNLQGGTAVKPAGITLQQVELGVSAGIDAYFRASLFLTLDNLQQLRVDEAYAVTTSLPVGLQVKAGVFRSAFGFENAEHLHELDFTRRSELVANYLGTYGLQSPGVQVAWVAPTTIFFELLGEAFSVATPADSALPFTFGGGRPVDLTYVLAAKIRVPTFVGLSLSGGVSAAFGNAAWSSDEGFSNVDDGDLTNVISGPSQLYGADLEVAYRLSEGVSFAWQSEVMMRQTGLLCARSTDNSCGGEVGPIEDTGTVGPQTDASFTTQVAAHLGSQWIVAARLDVLGLEASSLQEPLNRESVSVTFAPSDFSRVRLYGEREESTLPVPPGDVGPPPLSDLPASPEVYSVYLQLEIALGAHGQQR